MEDPPITIRKYSGFEMKRSLVHFERARLSRTTSRHEKLTLPSKPIRKTPEPSLLRCPMDFQGPGTSFRMGREPMGIDILTEIPGVEFDAAWSRRIEAVPDGETGLRGNVISRDGLAGAKRAAGRLRTSQAYRLYFRKTSRTRSCGRAITLCSLYPVMVVAPTIAFTIASSVA